MKVQLKPLSEQVVVITGASSGIGLTTARQAAKRGAKLVLAARSGEELHTLVNEITTAGGEAVEVVADVGKEEDVRQMATAAVAKFGRIDTWVNNAGIGIFGRVEETTIEDAKRLFDTNFWGVVFGSRVAAEYLRRTGGAIVTVGSVVSDRAVPLQGMYSASKHAVKGFTDALRMELEEQGAPISVTLIKPTSINTPFPQNAKNYMAEDATLPPPVYAPDAVAEAILHCAEHPMRDLLVGGGGKMISSGTLMPRLTDKYMEKFVFSQQKKDQPNPGTEQNALHGPSHHLSERGNYEGHTMESSLYTKAASHPLWTAASVVGAGLAVAALIGAVGGHDEPDWKDTARDWASRGGKALRNAARDWS